MTFVCLTYLDMYLQSEVWMCFWMLLVVLARLCRNSKMISFYIFLYQLNPWLNEGLQRMLPKESTYWKSLDNPCFVDLQIICFSSCLKHQKSSCWKILSVKDLTCLFSTSFQPTFGPKPPDHLLWNVNEKKNRFSWSNPIESNIYKLDCVLCSLRPSETFWSSAELS